LSVRRATRQRVRGGRGVRLTVVASEAASVRVTLRVPGVATRRSGSRTLQPAVAARLRVSVGPRVRAAVRRRSRRATLTVSARDPARNVSRVVRRVRLR
jgi:hypothetical protein